MTLTVADIASALPSHLRSLASQHIADMVNQIAADPDTAASIRGNFLTYADVLKEGRFKVEDYVNAVTYVSYKMMEMTNLDAFKQTFPQRYQTLVMRGASSKEISSHVAMYGKNKLVGLIFERAVIPAHVLYQDVFGKAIEVQANLMLSAKSEMVRMQAANSLLNNLRAPEKKEIALTLDVADSSGMTELKATLAALAESQLTAIQAGHTTREIAHQKLVRTDEMIDITPIEESQA